MALLVRAIAKPTLWYTKEQKRWLDLGLISADTLSDLATKRNEVSVYEVPSPEAVISVLVGLEVNRCKVHQNQPDGAQMREGQYLLFESQLVDTLKIDIRTESGKTGDSEVDSWHRNLSDLSGEKLLALAHALILGTQPATKFVPDMLADLAQREQAEKIPSSKISPKLRAQLDSFLGSQPKQP